MILIPEIPYQIDKIVDLVKKRKRRGRRFSIIVVAEGARSVKGEEVVQRIVKESPDPIRLGGVSFVLGEQLENMIDLETRLVIMGHLQRGGSPTSFDRVLATCLGTKAADLIAEKNFGKMVSVR